jgi:hypothetical protein
MRKGFLQITQIEEMFLADFADNADRRGRRKKGSRRFRALKKEDEEINFIICERMLLEIIAY